MKKPAVLLAVFMALVLAGCVNSLRDNAPEGYPHRHVPLYTGGNAHITGSSTQNMRGQRSFHVWVETQDAPDVAAKALGEAFGEAEDLVQSGDVCTLDAYLLSGEAGGWAYNIAIQSLGNTEGSEIIVFVTRAQRGEP